jgi:pimeloyl-ACP methyl ester carboxylesterase
LAVKSILYKNSSFEIAYDIINPSAVKTIVFLHGWGSNKEIMKQAFSSTLANFRHIYIDMPGFGKSTNSIVLTTQDYANIIKLFLEKTIQLSSLSNHRLPLTIAGHSFGGKVATLLNPKYLVLLSSAGILEQKPLSVRLKIKLAKLFKMLGLGSLTKLFRSSDVSQMSQNMYETFKNVVDEDFCEAFKAYSGKAYIFWGVEDGATSLKSGEKIHDLIQNSEFVSYNGDHYFFLKNSDDITKRLDNGIL